MNNMASSSPVSFKSQAHNHSPIPVSDQGFQSQVPFYTQLPYDRSPSEARKGQKLSPVSKPTPKCLPRTSKVNTRSQDLHTSRPRSNASSGKDFSDAQDLYESLPCRANVSDNRPATVPGEVEDEDEVTSSHESIECAPLGTNCGRLHAESPVENDAVDLPMPTKQPFPLVEWIRRIREEDSKSEWPTLPLKWSSSVSKQQRKILDDEDAWYPPLPGRPVRQGTIPIDILKELTLQVDQDAERKANEELKHSLPHPSRTSDQQPTVSQPQHLPSSPPSPSSIDETAVPWSSSPPYPHPPPRRQLPPDTSPLRPASNREQQFTAANKTPRQTSQDIPLVSKTSSNTFRKAAQSPSSGTDRIRSTQNSVPAQREGGKEAKNTNRASRIADTEIGTHSQKKPQTSPLREDLPLTSSGRTSRLPGTVPRSRPKIQVKDTPYPAKSLTRDRERFFTDGCIPESSLVPATYPEVAMAHQRAANSPERESSSLPHSQPARMTVPQAATQPIQTRSPRAERPLKRTFDKVDQEAHTVVAQPMSSHGHDDGSKPKSADNGQPERQPDEVDTRTTQLQSSQAEVRSPTTSEYKAEEELRLRNKELFDQKRMENRRAFRASISTSATRDGVKYDLTSAPKIVDENTRAISAAPSSPKSHGPTLAGSRSEGETSSTNLSLHETARPTKSSSHTTPQQTSVQAPVNTGGVQELFQSFVRAYPDYPGSLKSFGSALRLLVKLRSKPRDPHPSLWDDFVYRMADDYKAYLQECIDETESALAYPDFYYARVKQPKHRSGIITEEGVKIATSSTTKASTPLKRTSSNLPSHDDVIMVDANTPKSQLSRVHATRPTVDTVQDLQPPRDHKPPSRAAPTPAMQEPNKVPSNKSSIGRGHTNKTTKRQSMPWSTNKSNKPLTDTVMLQTQKILASSGEQTDSTAAVEQWLSRPAGTCSPEIELTQIQAPDQNITIAPSHKSSLPKVAAKKVADPRVQDPDFSRLRSLGYLATQKTTPAQNTTHQSPDPQPSVTASEITAAQAERPVTPFTMFARNFANLQSEKELRGGKKKLPINVYKW